jgi:hypothetical protein
MTTYQKVVYEGRFGAYQKYGNKFQKSQVQFEKDPFNAYQNFLYKRAMFGLSVYGEEELSKMHWDKKKRIQKVHTRCQEMLNVWKQELANNRVNKMLSSLFWHSSLVKDMLDKFALDTDPNYISNLEFKDLGISKQEIVAKLIQEKILPYNFYQLNQAV